MLFLNPIGRRGHSLRAVFAVFSALSVFALQGLSAQSAVLQNTAHVTAIRAESRGNLIRLTWTDTPGLRGPVYIYRSRQAFGQNSGGARPVEVPYGVQSYIDEVEEGGVWHYLVSVFRTGGGQGYAVLPFENTISIEVDAPGVFDAPPPRSRSGEAPPEPGIQAIQATVRGDGVQITFRQAAPGAGQAETGAENIILFRSVNPIRQGRDLENALIVENGVASPFMDYPVPGIPYYYALVPEADFLESRPPVMRPGGNVSADPVTIPVTARVGLRNSPAIRAMPLPLISVSAFSPQGSTAGETREAAPLSAGAEAASRGLAPESGSARLPAKSPRAFSLDLNNSSGAGEDYALGRIVQGPFLSRNWGAARDDLERYLSLPRSGAAEARARFYLGQARYYLGEYRDALFEFLLVQDAHPAEAAEWIQAALNRLAR
jgi:hypothetical protein